MKTKQSVAHQSDETASRCVYVQRHNQRREREKIAREFQCPYCDDDLDGFSDDARMTPTQLTDREIREIAHGLYLLDDIGNGRPDAARGDGAGDFGVLDKAHRVLRAYYEQKACNIASDAFVHPRQLLAFMRLVGTFGL